MDHPPVPFKVLHTQMLKNPDKKPEVYFNSLFDERMWTVISEATNVYAQSKCVTPTGNRCTDPTHDEYRKHCHLNTWIDVSPGDIKLFMAHILIMGLVNKLELENYWSLNSNTKIPFFGKYMLRNRFQAILWNLHVNDDSHNPRPSQPGYDPCDCPLLILQTALVIRRRLILFGSLIFWCNFSICCSISLCDNGKG